MSITEDMLNIRESFIRTDRNEAMKVMMWRIYYYVAPRVTSGDTFTIFKADEEIGNFCENNKLDRRAVEWLISGMRNEGLIEKREMPVVLTPLGVEKLCCH